MQDDMRSLLNAGEPSNRIQAIQIACKDKRTDLLPDLIDLLDSTDVGYFVEECLPAFGDMVVPLLKTVLTDPLRSEVTRERAAGILGHFGCQEAVPFLLAAIHSPNVNQGYFSSLMKLAPNELGVNVEAILGNQIDHALTTTEPALADYFAKLILTIKDLGRQPHVIQTLEHLLGDGRHWLIRASAAEALYPLDPQHYSRVITQIAEHSKQEPLLKLLQRLKNSS